MRYAVRCALVSLSMAVPVAGQQPVATTRQVVRVDDNALPAPQRFVTKHQITIGGQRIPFTATAGETYLYNDDGQPIGAVFSYAYVKDGVPPGSRPVAFVFGGGPGSASVMLQVGGIGPWAIPVDRLAIRNGRNPPSTPPFDVVDNQNSVLDVTDLVFVDPVGTGYSRVIGVGKHSDFWGIDQDASTMAQFIHLWITEQGRWNSPKFYIGESYGGYRAAVLTRALMSGPYYLGYMRGITLNGVVALVNTLGSPWNGTRGISPVERSAMQLPNHAATAWYHQTIDRRGRSLDALYEEAYRFAQNEYLPALRKDSAQALPPDERSAIVAKLVAFTGLPASAYASRLSLSGNEFTELALASRNRVVGYYDSRYTLSNAIHGFDAVADDAALTHSFPVLMGALANVEHSKLNVRMKRQFSGIHWRDLLPTWDSNPIPGTLEAAGAGGRGGRGAGRGTLRTVAEDLALSMQRNESLHLMIGTGIYDLLMPSAVARYVAEHTAFPKDRLTVTTYPVGHEVYLTDGAAKLAHDIRAFVRTATVQSMEIR